MNFMMERIYLWLYLLCLLIPAHGTAESKLANDFLIEPEYNSNKMLIDDLNDHLSLKSEVIIRQKNQVTIVEMSHFQEIKLQLSINIIDALDEFTEVSQQHDENRFVLESSPESDIFYLKKTLNFIQQKFCRHPIPRQYLIIMDTFKERNTQAFMANCRNPEQCFQQGSKYYKRSVNQRCYWKKTDHVIESDESLDQLPESLNSVYCTENSGILNVLFKETIPNTNRFVSDPKCEQSKARCADCRMLQCKAKKSCCRTDARCLLQDDCIGFFNASCHSHLGENGNSNEPICARGNTYKFTLLPEFDMDSTKFLCQLKPSMPTAKASFRISLKSKKFNLPYLEDALFNGNFFKSDVFAISDLNITLSRSQLKDRDVILLERNGYNFNAYSLKTADQFDTSPSDIHRHESRSYVRVQFRKPFQFSTIDWSNETCHVNVSDILKSQSLYDQSSMIPVQMTMKPELVRVDKSDVFRYVLRPSDINSTRLDIELSQKSSLLSIYFCQRNLIKPKVLSINIHYTDERTWIINVKGWTDQTINFFSFSIRRSLNQSSPTRKFDVVVIGQTNLPEQFNFSYRLYTEVDISNISNNYFHFVVDQCGTVLYQKFAFLSPNSNISPMTKTFIQHKPADISNFLLLLFLLSISISFIYFFLLAIQAIRKSKSTNKTKVSVLEKNTHAKINKILVLKIILFMTLKLFYTFSFTLSLILSISLSLNLFSQYSTKMGLDSKISNKNSLKYQQEKLFNSCSFNKDNFVEEINNLFSYQEKIRTSSPQSTDMVTSNIIDAGFVNKLKSVLTEFIDSTNTSSQKQFEAILGSAFNTMDKIENSKWLSVAFSGEQQQTTKAIESASTAVPVLSQKFRTNKLIDMSEITRILYDSTVFSTRLNSIKANITNVKKVRHGTVENLKFARVKEKFIRYYSTNNFMTFSTTLHSNDLKLFVNFTDEYFTKVDIIKIRLVFMLIDAVLIIYRCYWTYVDIKQMWSPKREIIQFEQMIIQTNQNFYNLRSKSNFLFWTKRHHLECLSSGHLVIAGVIIVVSLLCTNLLVFLTSREHAQWLSKKTGSYFKVINFKEIKKLIHHLTSYLITFHRQLHQQRVDRVKRIVSLKSDAIKQMIYFEVFLNRQYYSELCHVQNVSHFTNTAVNFCHFSIPTRSIIPQLPCDNALSHRMSITYDAVPLNSSRAAVFMMKLMYSFVNVLAVVLFIAAVVGLVKISRQILNDRLFGKSPNFHLSFFSQNQLSSTMNSPIENIEIKPSQKSSNNNRDCKVQKSRYQCKESQNKHTLNTTV